MIGPHCRYDQVYVRPRVVRLHLCCSQLATGWGGWIFVLPLSLTNICVHTHTHARVRAHTHTHTHTRTHTHTYTYTHIHTQNARGVLSLCPCFSPSIYLSAPRPTRDVPCFGSLSPCSYLSAPPLQPPSLSYSRCPLFWFAVSPHPPCGAVESATCGAAWLTLVCDINTGGKDQ